MKLDFGCSSEAGIKHFLADRRTLQAKLQRRFPIAILFLSLRGMLGSPKTKLELLIGGVLAIENEAQGGPQ